ncbi:Similar to SERPINI1: Neuroserpin (Gallus gallus) [Cotesia congregata]|uniref:Similar to SERPINI1: Neuroserpin (Gallus gallus) n=1 Tax=Cotesia congregata TaxID=51543 RepID=A0A8J2HGE5_COTCN|nr:Similar to SERPINI1: Neuroserpin (Gallus gallus) [Cotesia congregata]
MIVKQTRNPGHSLSMFVILPIKDGLEKTEQTLGYIDYRKLHFKAHEDNIELYMPKFKIASTIDLQPILDMMGMRRMFRDRTDFSGITDKFMKITKAVQKAVIEMSEENKALHTVASSINQFTTNFYKALARDESSNFICSPISVSMVLSMVTYGARGNTEKELRNALRLSDDDQVNKNGFQSLVDTLNAVEKVELRLANKIYFNVGFDVKTEFKELTEKIFRSVSEIIDFGKSAEAAETINTDLCDSQIVLINAVYFRGEWKWKFNPKYTEPEPFHIDENTVKDVPMMRKEARYNYNELPDLDAKIIELFYKSSDGNHPVTMFIILPNEVNGANKIEVNLHDVNFKDLHENAGEHMKECELQLPRFKVESTLNLKNILTKLGLNGIFEPSANFSGISESSQLSVSKVIQKTILEVDEIGSVAASVTVAVIMPKKGCLMEPTPFIVNRPFVCVIVATETGTPLFNAPTSLDKFSTNFYQALARDESSNFICSPVSVSMVLSMVTYGARGNTEKELRNALRLSDDDQVNKNGFQSLVDTLNAVKKVELRLANKIYFNVGFDVKTEFKELTEKTFRSVSEVIDFGKSAKAAGTINAWCEEKTNNRIKDFDPELTEPMPFYVDENTTKQVPMMYRKAHYNFGHIPEFEATYVELPYESTDSSDSISMFIILPTEMNGLKACERHLHEINFKDLHRDRARIEVELRLPKFKIESEFQLQDTLVKMGVKEIFENSADFGNITDSERLKVSKVIQKAFIEVNEEGSEAAAVTALIAVQYCLILDTPSITVDKPFICAIVATDTGMQLFNARINDPTLI